MNNNLEKEIQEIGNDIFTEVKKIMEVMESKKIAKYTLIFKDLLYDEKFFSVIKLCLKFNFGGNKYNIESVSRGEVYRMLIERVFNF